jgi:hypothetical protein
MSVISSSSTKGNNGPKYAGLSSSLISNPLRDNSFASYSLLRRGGGITEEIADQTTEGLTHNTVSIASDQKSNQGDQSNDCHDRYQGRTIFLNNILHVFPPSKLYFFKFFRNFNPYKENTLP